ENYEDIDWKALALEGIKEKLNSIASTLLSTIPKNHPEKLDLTAFDAEVIRKADEAWTKVTGYWPYIRALVERPPVEMVNIVVRLQDAMVRAIYWEARRRWMEEGRGKGEG